MGIVVPKEGSDTGAVEVPAEELAAIRSEFDRRWWRQAAISGQVMVLAFPTMIALDGGAAPDWAVALMLASIGLALVGSFWNWRCPSCKSYFGKQFFRLKFCATCGVPLVES